MWIDIAIVGLMLFSIIQGIVKGFISNVLRLASWLFALLVASLFWGKVATLLNLGLDLEAKIAENLGRNYPFSMDGGTQAGQTLTLPSQITDIVLAKMGNTGQEVAGYFFELVAYFIVSIIAFLVITFVVKIVISVILSIVSGFTGQIGIAKALNRFLGFLLGIFKGVVIIYIFLMILVPGINLLNNEFLNHAYETAFLTKYMYQHNLLFILLDL